MPTNEGESSRAATRSRTSRLFSCGTRAWERNGRWQRGTRRTRHAQRRLWLTRAGTALCPRALTLGTPSLLLPGCTSRTKDHVLLRNPVSRSLPTPPPFLYLLFAVFSRRMEDRLEEGNSFSRTTTARKAKRTGRMSVDLQDRRVLASWDPPKKN